MTFNSDERFKLFQTLNAIAPEQLGQIIFTLSPPSGIIPPSLATQGQRVEALVNWASSPGGCGLVAVRDILNKIIPNVDNENTTTSDSKPGNVYIERPPIEEECYQEISRAGGLIRLKAPQKMGKTYLMNWLFEQMSQSQEYQAVVFDLLEPEEAVVSDLDELLRYFCSSISLGLGLPDKVEEFWQKKRAKTLKCRTYFEKEILASFSSNLIIAIDNIDRIFASKYKDTASDFFGMLRAWYGNAQTQKNWQKLRLILVYSTEDLPNLGIYQSPFNVGKEIKLLEFTPQQIQDLASYYQLNWTEKEVKSLIDLVGGHPYLIHKAINHLGTYRQIKLDELLLKAATDEGIFYQHFQSYWKILENDRELEEAFKEIIFAEVPLSIPPKLLFKLESLGLIRKSDNQVRPRCLLYQRYFRAHLG